MNATVAYGAFYDRNTSTYNYTDYKFFKFWFAFHQTVTKALPETGETVILPAEYTGNDCVQFRKHLPPGTVTITMDNGIPISVMENGYEYTKDTTKQETNPELEHLFIAPDKRHAICITTKPVPSRKFSYAYTM